VKVNVNAAFDSSSGNGGIGVIIRDATGKALLTSWCFVRHAREAEEVEATAAREGLSLAAEWRRLPSVLEVDCSTRAQMLHRREGERSQLKFIIDEAI
jgi:ribonuclease HI